MLLAAHTFIHLGTFSSEFLIHQYYRGNALSHRFGAPCTAYRKVTTDYQVSFHLVCLKCLSHDTPPSLFPIDIAVAR